MTKTFSEKLKEARIKKGFSKKDLARAVEVNPVTIAKYENENFIPSLRILKKIDKVLDLDIELPLKDFVAQN